MRPDTDVLGIGIIGYGGFGQFLHRSWSTVDEVAVRAVADTNPDARAAADVNARRFSGRSGGRAAGAATDAGGDSAVSCYADWRALLADPSIDIVSIVTPPFTHADMACEAMRAGKHVLIEKPLATTSKDSRRIQATAVETGRIAGIDYMLRFNPIVETLQRWARDGSFGALRRVVVENYAQDESLSREHWFWDSEQSGGILVEHAVHFIDVVNGCTDARTVSIDGLAVEREDGRIDRMGLTAIYADGLVTQQYHAFSRPGFFEETGTRFVFDLAQVDVEGWIPLCGTLNALVRRDTMPALGLLPGLTIDDRKPISEAEDSSRPNGWGPSDERVDARTERSLRSGGVAYQATEQVLGRFALPSGKSDAYADAVRAIMADFVVSVEHPSHRLRAGLPEAESSLGIALRATERAIDRMRGQSLDLH